MANLNPPPALPPRRHDQIREALAACRDHDAQARLVLRWLQMLGEDFRWRVDQEVARRLSEPPRT